MSNHGNAEAVTMHRHLGEPLCPVCMAYLNRLQREAFRVGQSDDIVHLTIALPRAAYWELSARAESAGVSAPDHIAALAVDTVQAPGRGITFTQEKQIRALWLAGKSTAEIVRQVGVSNSAVIKRIQRWGGTSNGRKARPKE